MKYYMSSISCVLAALAWMSGASCRPADEQAGSTIEAQPAAPLEHPASLTPKEEQLPALDGLLAAAGLENPPPERIVVVVGVLDGEEVRARPAGGGLCHRWFEGKVTVEEVLHGKLRRSLDVWLNRWSVESDTIPRRKRCIFVIKLPESDDWRLDEHDFLAIYLIEEQRFARTMEADDQAGATSQAQPAASLDHDRAFTSKEEPLPSLETLLAAAGANNQVSDRIVVVVGVLDGGKMCSLPARGGIRDLTFEGQIDVEDLLHGNLRRPLEVSLNLWNKESDTIPLHKTCIFVIKLPMSDTGRLHERDFLAIYLIEEHRFARAMEMPGKSSGG